MQYAVMDSPMGPLTVASTEKGIASIHFGNSVPEGVASHPSANRETVEQLTESFEGKRTRFELPLDVEGTPFQKAVWNELQRIPYGETRSYEDIAAALGQPSACRAVGSANGRNRIAILVPCHRVVRKDGTLGGYGGGLWRKQRLLEIERAPRVL